MEETFEGEAQCPAGLETAGQEAETVLTEPEVPAGRLHTPAIPPRSSALADASLQDITGEVIARLQEGSFTSSEEAILSGATLQRELAAALDVHNNRFSRRRYRDLFGAFYEWMGPGRPCIPGSVIVDLGCGALNPYGLMFLFLMLGARRGIAVDLDTIHDPKISAQGLAGLAAGMLLTPKEYIGDYSITPWQLLANIASFDLAKLTAGDLDGLDPDRLSFLHASVEALPLETGAVDLVVSNAFLEHIPRVEAAIAELCRITRPGGYGAHVIDASDHRRYQDSSHHPLEFLTEGSDGSMLHGSNRLRPAQFATAFENHGFEVIALDAFAETEVDENLRGRLIEPYRSMSDEHLRVSVAKLVVRKR